MGYPPGFLKALAAEFPELRSLVVYSQQFTGILDESSDDATEFIRGAKKLRALHLLDAHISAAFVKAIAPSIKELEKPLMFIEINYTNRSNVDALLEKIPAAELPLLIHQGLISCSFNIAPPEHKQSERSDLLSIGDGIGVLSKNHSKLLVDKLLDDDSAPKVMKHLNTTLYPISIENLHNILAKHKGLMVLNVSIEVDDATSYRSKLFETLVTASNLEQIELVLCPSDSVTELDIRVDDQAMRALSTACKKLTSLKVNQRRCLRSKSSLECTIDDGKWHIKYNESEQTKVSEQPKSKASRPVRDTFALRVE